MKNRMSKKLFDVPYSELPLASECIVDLKLSALKWKILSFISFSAVLATVLSIFYMVR